MKAAQLLARDGPLADCLPGFAPRDVQQKLSSAVEETLEERAILVAEAGTGVGKTIAYLTPVLRSGLRTVISTATRHLQDQLFHRDLPVVRRAIGYGEPVALLKGRANYLCHYRLAQTSAARARLPLTQLRDLEIVEAWSAHTGDGDVAGVGEVAEDSGIWPRVTSTVENCLGAECPHLSGCHVLEARRRAQAARVVVVNHHLLFADLALKEEGFGEVLPSAEAFVLDEAHQLPDIAGNFFGRQLSSRQLLGLSQDAIAEHLRDAADARAIREHAEALAKRTRDLRLAFGEDRQRAPWQSAPPAVDEALEEVRESLQALAAELEVAAPRGKGLEHCYRRARALLGEIASFAGPGEAGAGEDDTIRWFETYARGFALRATPVDVAGLFRTFVEHAQAAWVMTSATLAVDGSFRHFRQRLGLDDARELLLDSPFDYANNALLYLPRELPEPNSREHSAAVASTALAILPHSRGRMFVLVTSLRALSQVATQLRPAVPYPVLVQGDAPKAELLERFREAGDAVLIGTNSFWEGVDVRGPALSCVIIDKLPFAAIGDPVLQSRLEVLRRQGLDPFRDYQLPQAVITLKQGVGRLIRDAADRGVLVICDPRLTSRGYGRTFIASLPPMPITREIGDVEAFFDADAGPA